jgi:N-acetylneuraminic acid mutarotase
LSRRRAFQRPVATVVLIGLSAGLLSACGGPGTWHTLASSPSARQEVSFVYSPRAKKFFLAGGHSPMQEAYDPRTDTWTSVAPLPAALDHIQSVEHDGLIYYIGGLIAWPLPAVGSVYIYDPGSDRVSSGTPMPAGRERGAGGVAVYGDKIYYAGGLHAGVAVPWFDVYDTVTRTWSRLPDMPEPRDHFQAGVVGARFYAIGGRNTSIDATTTVNDAFDFTTGAWVTGLAPLPTPRGGFATAVLGTKLVIIGGEGGGRTFQTVEAYDTSANAWQELAAMPTARHGIEGAVCNGGVYIADGGTAQGGTAPTSRHEVFFLGGPAACP